ncbi:protein bric-a-brac 2-like [Hylaeus anthracinus]|uniref:protein bric-a-brac 2-like n=1 Tax=Hylaeus anthracinus TaxID=313031 RepID=UPI0023B94860|nr:protein bric-a-brac 2-like [Hylaeus anthracinus]
MAEDAIMSLKWHSFPSHLAISLDTCYEKQQFVDLSLVCKDGTILKCHKMVLANSSSFFRRLLVANDHPHPMIILHDVEADDLKTIVNFMYCGEIQVVQSEVRRLLKLAEILEVTGLRHIQTSVLIGEANNAPPETSRKTTTVSRLKFEETKSLPTKAVSDHESNNRPQNKPTRFISPTRIHKGGIKLPQESIKKSDEGNTNLLSQRLEAGRSGISIVDINDMPSTSRGISNPPPQKRKEHSDPVISWPSILSAISKDKPLSLKKLCIMDEVEITAGKSPVTIRENQQHDPLDRRKHNANLENNQSMKCAVYIKDEIDITPDMEEDEDMDPLEVEEAENECPENIRSSQMFSYTNIDQTPFNTGTLPEFPPRKGSNG